MLRLMTENKNVTTKELAIKIGVSTTHPLKERHLTKK